MTFYLTPNSNNNHLFMRKVIAFLVLLTLIISACDKDENVVYDPTLYALNFGGFPNPNLSPDNIPTLEGVKLGRMLFYEKTLSKDGSMACADCHLQKDMFSDI